MIETASLKDYLKLLDELKKIVDETNNRVTSSVPDDFFSKNVNFFTKSFMVLMCAYLESYLKDALMEIVEEMNDRLSKNCLPQNLIRWSFSIHKDLKPDEIQYANLKIGIERKNLDEHISGNPFRTSVLFAKFGIDLNSDPIYDSQKDKINTIIVKRNNILHHNDDASDISLKDIKSNIDFIKLYISNLDSLIANHLRLV